jgi:uroporphyrinogen-III synthase
MRVLVTRPKEDAERLAVELRARGHEPIVSPLMDIRFIDGPEIRLAKFQAVLATSANGIRALVRRTQDRATPVFAVGPQTAAAAQEAGFSQVRNAGGDAVALATRVREWADPKAGPLLHAAARERAGGLAEALTASGFSVEIAVVYEGLESKGFSDVALSALAAAKIDAVMLFSPRSARLFAEHLQKSGLKEDCRDVVALCISEPASQPLRELPLSGVYLAHRPDEESMLALLDETAAAP